MSIINIGDKYTSNSGDFAVVVAISKNRECTIKYLDSFGHEQRLRVDNLVRGRFKNPYKPVVFGVGYIGVGDYRASYKGSRKKTLEYQAWKDMLKRCYSEKFLSKNKSYLGCSVSEDFLNFQVFAEWYTKQKNYGKGYHLDKDLLIKGNREYSKNACSLLPAEINSAINIKSDCVGKDLPKCVQNTPSGRYVVRVRGLKGGSYVGTYDELEDAVRSSLDARTLRMVELHNKYESSLSEKQKVALLNW